VHLYKSAKMKTILGLHTLLPFSPYVPPRLNNSAKVNLWSKPGGDLIAQDLTFKQLLEEHVKPGHFLCPTETMARKHAENWDYIRENDLAHQYNNYYIAEFKEQKTKVKKTSSMSPMVKEMARLMELHFDLGSPEPYYKISMDRMMSGLQQGRPVEVCMRISGKHVADKYERQMAGNPTIWPWMHQHFPHLHPDVIKAGMPEGTYFCIKPWSNGRHVQFVLAPNTKMANQKLDKNLRNKKELIQQSIDKGHQSQLPKVLRQKLIQEGQDSYSLDTGLPRVAAFAREIEYGERRWVIPRERERADDTRNRWEGRGGKKPRKHAGEGRIKDARVFQDEFREGRNDGLREGRNVKGRDEMRRSNDTIKLD
jgi:hypothetical protein